MRPLSWLVSLLAVIVIVFAVMNGEEMTAVWPLPITLPVYLVIFGSFFLGFVLGGLVTWFSGGRRRQRARQLSEHARTLARQLAEMQRQRPVAQPGPTLTPTEGGGRLPLA
jgi:uncharacterized integral membrane protein